MSLTTEQAARGNAWFPIQAGEPVTAWTMSEVVQKYFPGVAATAEDRVDYRFINGFVDVGDLPCRKHFWSTMVGREMSPLNDWPVAELHLPGSNKRVEFTSFWHVPTHVSRWLRGTIRCEARQKSRFSLSTCGGVRIWANDVEVCKFEPFRRNVVSNTEIEIDLEAGDNDILIHTEDLAERDTIWFVELVLVSGINLEIRLPVSLNQAEVQRLTTLSHSARPARDVFTEQQLEIVFDEPAGQTLLVELDVISHGHEHALLASGRVELGPEDKSLLFATEIRIPDGYHAVRLTLGHGTSKVVRTIDAAFMSSLTPLDNGLSFQQRKRAALEHSADFGVERIGRALAMIATERLNADVFKRILDATLESIERREDCSDFVMVPMLWLAGGFSDKLSRADVDRIRNTALGYRYWVDEPGNDTMWFWSENHVLCFHVSQLLAGRLYPSEIFSASGRTGAQQATIAEERLRRWFDSVDEHGLAEWNSAAYYPVDFIGLFALAQWGGQEMSEKAIALLDNIFKMVALHTLAGVPAGSQGRAYDKELRAGPLTELGPFAQVAFGTGWLNDGVASLPLFCLGDYEPPEGLGGVVAVGTDRCIEARYSQGLQAGNLVLFKNEAAQLSTVVDHKTGTAGHQQHVLDIRLAGHPMARLWINNPGEDDPWGSQRPSYWAGNGMLPRVTQHLDTALAIFDTSKSRLDWTHAYLGRDGLDEVVVQSNWLFGRSGRGFAALYASNGLSLVNQGPTAGREIRSSGSVCGWAAIIGSGNPSSFEQFKERILRSKTGFDAERRSLVVQVPGGPLLSLVYDGGLSVDGHLKPFVHHQPYPVLTFDSNASPNFQDRPLLTGKR